MLEINTKIGLDNCVTKMERAIIDQFADKYRFQIGIPVSGRRRYYRKRKQEFPKSSANKNPSEW